MNIYWEESERSWDGKNQEFKRGKSKLSEAIIYTPPPVVGGYDITGSNQVAGSIVFSFTKKPNWFHRTCCRLFLGWRWQDKKEEKKKEGLLLG